MRSLYLGRAFGIPLYIHWSFLLLPLWVVFSRPNNNPVGIAFALVLLLSAFGCVLLHELGHALMARAFRIATRDITLYPIGGVARLESTGHSPYQEVCIALAGPAVNLVLLLLLAPLAVGGIWLGGWPPHSEVVFDTLHPGWLLFYYLACLCISNAVLLLFNLVPAFPMDGGRVLRALLAVRMGLIPATRVASTIGMVLAIGMGLAGVTLFKAPLMLLVSVFVVFAGQAELFNLRRMEALRQRQRDWQHQRDQIPVETLVRAGDPLDPAVPMRPVGTIVPVAESGPFTGFLWDADLKVWVRWVDGRRIDVF